MNNKSFNNIKSSDNKKQNKLFFFDDKEKTILKKLDLLPYRLLIMVYESFDSLMFKLSYKNRKYNIPDFYNIIIINELGEYRHEHLLMLKTLIGDI